MNKYIRFGDIATGFDYGMNSAAVDYDGKNKYIRITDIDEKSGIYNPIEFVSPDGVIDEKYLVKPNDILLARTGASVGKSYLHRDVIDNLYFAGFLIRANVNGADPNYVYQFLQTKRYDEFVKINSARSGQPGLNAEEYKKLRIPVPDTYEKQVKYGKLLSSLDTLIELTSEQAKNIGNQKSYMLNKIFNDKVGDKEIVDNQKSHIKLDLVVNYISSNLSMNSVSESSTYPVYGANSLVGYTEKKISNDEYVSIVKDGAGVGRILKCEPKTNILGTMGAMTVKEGYDLNYITQFLKSVKWDTYISGSRILHLYFSDYKNLKLVDKSYQEQQKIGKLLSSMDTLLELLDN